MINKKINIIFCLISMIFVCNSAFARRVSARDKACFSNIRVIQGAVEMYNMDSSIMMENLDIENLKKGKYLKEEPVKPEVSCEYKNFGNLADDGFVFCKYHGDLERILDSEYYKDNEYEQYEKVPQNATMEEYKGNRERILRIREENNKRIEFKNKFRFYSHMIGIPIGIILLIMAIVPSRKKVKQ